MLITHPIQNHTFRNTSRGVAQVQGICVSRSVMSKPLHPRGLQPARLLCPWDSPGRNTAVGWYVLPQGIFPTQGLNPSLLHCRRILHCVSHRGRPQGIKLVPNVCCFEINVFINRHYKLNVVIHYTKKEERGINMTQFIE